MKKPKYIVIYVVYIIHIVWVYPWLSEWLYQKSVSDLSFPTLQFFLLTTTYIITGIIGTLMVTIQKKLLFELFIIDLPIIVLLNTYTLYSKFSIVFTNYKAFNFYVSISAVLFGVEVVRYIKYFKNKPFSHNDTPQ